MSPDMKELRFPCSLWDEGRKTVGDLRFHRTCVGPTVYGTFCFGPGLVVLLGPPSPWSYHDWWFVLQDVLIIHEDLWWMSTHRISHRALNDGGLVDPHTSFITNGLSWRHNVRYTHRYDFNPLDPIVTRPLTEVRMITLKYLHLGSLDVKVSVVY